jgi:hypothetical protein
MDNHNLYHRSIAAIGAFLQVDLPRWSDLISLWPGPGGRQHAAIVGGLGPQWLDHRC